MDYAGRDDVSNLASGLVDIAVKDNLCAQILYKSIGSLYIPKAGDKVFYFMQGHMEQVAIYHHQHQKMDIPNFGLPCKILCLVIDVRLQAHVKTDEIFTPITLIPWKQEEFMEEDNHPVLDDSPNEIYSFTKMLETSTNAAGLYITKEHAERCFPTLDMTGQPPMQDLVVKDLYGNKWNFLHIYCDHKKQHMLTGGWSTFVNSKKLVPGDSCIFVRGENGDIGIGIRRAIQQYSEIWKTSSSPLTPIMCVASHAVSTETMFKVEYYPCTAPFEFMITLKTYVESIGRDYPIGTRVRRLAEVEGSARRYGTIVGNEDIDPINWSGSEWRCIKVQWDSIPPNTCIQLERVCPWWIEPLGSPKIKVIGSSSKPEYHTVDMDMQGQRHYNARNDENSLFFIFAFFVLLCFVIFVIFVFRPLL